MVPTGDGGAGKVCVQVGEKLELALCGTFNLMPAPENLEQNQLKINSVKPRNMKDQNVSDAFTGFDLIY